MINFSIIHLSAIGPLQLVTFRLFKTQRLKMKGILLLSMTIFFALCIIDGCEGWPRFPKPRKPTYPGPTWPRPTWPRPTWRRSATINTEHKRATLNNDIQDEDIENGDVKDVHLDKRYVDMNDNDVIDDIDERYVNDPGEDD